MKSMECDNASSASAAAADLSSAPIHLFSVSGKNFFCCPDGIYVASYNQCKCILAYKYKVEAVAFCQVLRDKLLSLHVKHNGTAFVELTQWAESAFRCISPCLLKFQVTQVIGQVWMEAARVLDLETNKFVLTVAVGPKSNWKTAEVAEEKESSWQVVNLRAETSSRIEVLFRMWKVSEELKGRLSGQNVAGLTRFSKGLVATTAGGRVWQYTRTGRSMLPVRNMALLCVREEDDVLVWLTKAGSVKHLLLPYRKEGVMEHTVSDDGFTEAMSEAQVVRQLADNVAQLEDLGKQRELNKCRLEQVKLAVMLKLAGDSDVGGKYFSHRSWVSQVRNLDGTSQARIAVKVTNESEHVFNGKFWSLNLIIGNLVGEESALPESLRPGDAHTAWVQLPEDLNSLERWTTKAVGVWANLIFQDQDTVSLLALFDCKLDVLDFLSSVVVTGEQSIPARSSRLYTEESLSESAEKVLKGGGQQVLSKQTENEHNSVLTSMTVLLPQSLLTDLSWKPSIADLSSMAAECGADGRAILSNCHLFGERVDLGMDFATVKAAKFRLTMTAACPETLLALKAALQQEMNFPNVKCEMSLVDRAALSKVRIVREELLSSELENEIEEDAAVVQACYKKARRFISENLL